MAKVCIKTSGGKVVCGQLVSGSFSGVEGAAMTCKKFHVTDNGNLRCDKGGYGGRGLTRGEAYPEGWVPVKSGSKSSYSYRGPGGVAMRSRSEAGKAGWAAKSPAQKKATIARLRAGRKPKKGTGVTGKIKTMSGRARKAA